MAYKFIFEGKIFLCQTVTFIQSFIKIFCTCVVIHNYRNTYDRNLLINYNSDKLKVTHNVVPDIFSPMFSLR